MMLISPSQKKRRESSSQKSCKTQISSKLRINSLALSKIQISMILMMIFSRLTEMAYSKVALNLIIKNF
jgi:hypothetical protein